jgi:tetratricopeptide (TPR) repeat protein
VSGEAEYAFRHVLVREVGYGQIPRSARAAKHVAAADWVESLGRLDDHAELLAHHYATALELAAASGQQLDGVHERASVALRNAGDRAALLHSHQAAADFYAAALELWPADGADRARLAYALGRAEYFGGEANAGRLHEAIDELLGAGLSELAAEAEATAAEAAWHRGERDELERRLTHALELVEPARHSPTKAWIFSQISRYAMLGGDPERAIGFGSRALELATKLDLPEVRVHALNNLGSARLMIGDADGLMDVESSATLAEELNSPELARSLNNLASALYAEGDVRRCCELELQAIAAAERFGLESMLPFSRANVLGSYLRLGPWDDLVAAADQLIAAQPPAGAESAARSSRARVRAARGDVAGALEDASWGLELVSAARDPQFVIPTLDAYAFVLYLAGDRAASEEVVHDLLERLQPLRAFPFRVPGDTIAFWLSCVGRERVARILAERTGETLWLSAACAFVEGDFARAVQIYGDMGCLPDAAAAQVAAAEELLVQRRRAEAEGYAQAALSFYRSVGATRLMRDAERLLPATA